MGSITTERPLSFATDMLRAVRGGYKTQTRRPTYPQDVDCREGRLYRTDGREIVCPFGVPGNRLWVRERFAFLDGDSGPVVYSADPVKGRSRLQWLQSRYLPREASRILLEVMGTRAERLQSISVDDAKNEGYPPGQALDPLAWYQRLWNRLTAPEQLRWAANPWVWVVNFRVLESVAADSTPTTEPSRAASDKIPAKTRSSTRGERCATLDEKRTLVQFIKSNPLGQP